MACRPHHNFETQSQARENHSWIFEWLPWDWFSAFFSYIQVHPKFQLNLKLCPPPVFWQRSGPTLRVYPCWRFISLGNWISVGQKSTTVMIVSREIVMGLSQDLKISRIVATVVAKVKVYDSTSGCIMQLLPLPATSTDLEICGCKQNFASFFTLPFRSMRTQRLSMLL